MSDDDSEGGSDLEATPAVDLWLREHYKLGLKKKCRQAVLDDRVDVLEWLFSTNPYYLDFHTHSYERYSNRVFKFEQKLFLLAKEKLSRSILSWLMARAETHDYEYHEILYLLRCGEIAFLKWLFLELGFRNLNYFDDSDSMYDMYKTSPSFHRWCWVTFKWWRFLESRDVFKTFAEKGCLRGLRWFYANGFMAGVAPFSDEDIKMPTHVRLWLRARGL